MAETDSPLKRLLHSSVKDFAAWLLNAEVLEAYTANIELPGGEPVRKADCRSRIARSSIYQSSGVG